MILEILDKMLLAYYALYFRQPDYIVMNAPIVKKQFASEITFVSHHEYFRNGTYRGIDIIFDTKEPFISLKK